MKLLLLGAFVFAFARADPPRYGRNSDQDVEIQQVEVIEIPWQEEPQQAYGPPLEQSPPNPAYGPPQQEYGPPKQEYGPPSQEYGPPKPVYGPPPEPTTTEVETTTTELPTTTEININSTANNTNNSTRTRFSRLEKDESTVRGAYHIYHPNGALQRVVYATKDDVRNMAYSVQLNYQNVEPIRQPIYTYDPQTYLFQRINRK